MRVVEFVLRDVSFTYRGLKRRPTFALSVLIILTIGIGASTAIFSVIDRALFTPLPYSEPERLVRMFGTWDRGSREGISPPDFDDYRRRIHLLQAIAASSNSTPLVSLSGAGEPQQITTRSVSADFFSTLGIVPSLGREFSLEEEAWRGPRVAILSAGLWSKQFGSDRTIVGRTIGINGVPYVVVGVLPVFFNALGPTDLFTPLQSNPVAAMRGIRNLTVIGRLREGMIITQAESELQATALNLQQEHLEFNRGWSARLVPLGADVVKDARAALLMLLAGVALLVLLVAANVASLVLAEAATRRDEICLRMSLGASRARITQQLLTESVSLACAGGLGGCAFAWWLLGIVRLTGRGAIPRLGDASMDVRALAFALVVSLGVGVLCALEPAWQMRRRDLSESLRGVRSVSARVGVRDAFVVAEVSISVVLLIAAALMIQSLLHLEQVYPGFVAAQVVTTRLAVPTVKYSDGTGEKLNAFWRNAIGRVEDIHGVTAAGVISELPLGGLDNPSPRLATTAEGRAYQTSLRSVSPGYAAAMQIPLRSGRFFTSDDRLEGQRVAVISEQFEKDAFGGRSALGERLMFNFQNRSERENYTAVIVGVIGDVRHASLALPPFREVYLPVEQSPLPSYDLVVRISGESGSVTAALRRELRSLDPDEAVGAVKTLDDVVSTGLAQSRLRGYLSMMFSGFALLLAGAGLYGLLSFSVTQRVPEIGLRMAIGATPLKIFRSIVGRSVLLTAAGLVIGLAMSVALSRLFRTLVFGLTPTDPATFLTASAILAATAMAAGYVPARRAAALDPARALRNQ